MKLAAIYITGAIIVGILQIIDGTLLILNKGMVGDFNIVVTLIELMWFFISITFILVFRRLKLSRLSPLSFFTYIFFGWTIVLMSSSNQSTDVNIVPIGYAILGAVFGLYYVVINERLRGRLADYDRSSSE